MPTYIYGLTDDAAEKGCDVCINTFEAVQAMSEQELKKCPKCGAAVERKPCVPNVGKGKVSKKSMENAGFTQYRKKGKGLYEKEFGSGPKEIRKGK